MKKIVKKVSRWFDLNLGWLFINGNKTEQWDNYISKKYNIKQDTKLPF